MIFAAQTVQNLPPAGLVPVVLIIVVGMVLWAAGRRVLRAAFAAAGLIVGAALGWTLATTQDLGISPWYPTLIVALVLACVAALGYRLALAAAMAAVFAVAGPAAVVTIGEMQGAPDLEGIAESAPPAAEPPAPRVDESNAWLFPGKPEGGGDTSAPLALGAEALAGARQDAERVIEAGRSWWDRTPERLRHLTIGAAISGALAGLLIGTLAPAFTALVVSAFGGSLVWLGGLRILIERIGEPLETLLPAGTGHLVLVWLIISVLGVVIQWTIRPKEVDKPG